MTSGDRYVLLAVREIRHRTGSDRAAGLELPQRFARARVEREEVAFLRSAEYETTGGRHHARPWRRWQREVPHWLPGLHVDGANRAPRFLVEPLFAAAGVVGPGFVLDARLVVDRSHFADRHIEHLRRRAVRRT